MYEIITSDKFEKQVAKLPKDIQERIDNAFERIKIRPYSYVLRLVGSPYYRLRVGDYRIILDIKDSKLIIFVLEMGHRKEIYR